MRSKASLLPSLRYFHPEFMSLVKPHQLWLTSGSNPYEVGKAAIQAQFLSSRYRSEQVCRHWSSKEKGLCLSATCNNQVETSEHILLVCPAYTATRERLKALWLGTSDPNIHTLVSAALDKPTPFFMQFLLDCSVTPDVISAAQLHGQMVYDALFYLTRTWCFSIHRERLKLLDRWNFR